MRRTNWLSLPATALLAAVPFLPSPVSAEQRVSHTADEQSDEIFPLSPDNVNKVDAHSVLVVAFPKTTAAGNMADTKWAKPWQDLQEMLSTVDDLTERRLALNQKFVSASDAEAVAELQTGASALDDDAGDLLIKLMELGLTGTELRELRGETGNTYTAISRWINKQLDALTQEANQFREDRKVNVYVRGFRDSVTGKRSPLHIPEWDNLADGAYSPIDRTGMRPNEGEQERLAKEREIAETTVAAVREIQSKSDELNAALKANWDKFKEDLTSLIVTLAKRPRTWPTPADIDSALNQELTGATADQTAAAANLKKDIEDLGTIVTRLDDVFETIEDFWERVSNAGSSDPIELLIGAGGLLAAWNQVETEVIPVVADLKTVNSKLADIAANLRTLEPLLTADIESRILSLDTKGSLQEIAETLPNTMALLTSAADLFTGTTKHADGLNQLKDPGAKPIPHTIDNLVDARLDLKRGGLALGDLITINIRTTRGKDGDLIDSVTYQNEVGFMGAYGKPSVHFIMTRGLSGDDEAREWQPNVAAGVEWYYGIRDPDTRFKKTWAWINPSFGVHVASLDQGEDSFEIGTGGTVALWDGLVSAGYGYNFSERDEYIFIGLNLLRALPTTGGPARWNRD
ncbi:MAG: hypothetical protein WD490_03285 [Opitutales bacterium]